MTEIDYFYFLRRAAEERMAAEQATHPVARRSHLELADLYDKAAEAQSGKVVQLKVAARA